MSHDNFHDGDDDHDDDDDRDFGDDSDSGLDVPQTFPLNGYALSGMDMLNEVLVMRTNFFRNKEGDALLDVAYGINAANMDILGMKFETLNSDEAYLTLYDDDGERRCVIVMRELELQEMELVTDEDCIDESMYVNLSYKAKSFEQQIVRSIQPSDFADEDKPKDTTKGEDDDD